MEIPHPLELWIKTRPGLKAWRFADDNEIPRTSIYALIRGENLNPTTELMKKIERATKRGVTCQAMSDWADKRARDNAA